MSRRDWEHWNSKAEGFEKKQYRIAGSGCDRETDQWLLSRLDSEDIFMDLGCGTGRISRLVSPVVSNVVSVDGSPAMVERCISLSESFANITVAREDCMELPFPDGVFSAVLMSNLLHIVSDPAGAVAEAVRVLKPGGRLLAVDYSMKGMNLLQKQKMIARYLALWGPPPSSTTPMDNEQIAVLFKDKGLRIKDSVILGGKTKAACVEGEKPLQA